jgi:hypothetical protein
VDSGAPGVPGWAIAGGAPGVPPVVALPAGGDGGVSWNHAERLTKKARILEDRPAPVDSSRRGAPGSADELPSRTATPSADPDVDGFPPGAADAEIIGFTEMSCPRDCDRAAPPPAGPAPPAVWPRVAPAPAAAVPPLRFPGVGCLERRSSSRNRRSPIAVVWASDGVAKRPPKMMTVGMIECCRSIHSLIHSKAGSRSGILLLLSTDRKSECDEFNELIDCAGDSGP